MAGLLIGLIIGLPWIGAVAVWLVRDRRPRLQHTLAVGFSVAGALAALMLIPLAKQEIAFSLSMGKVYGELTFTADGLGVFLAAVASAIGSLCVIFSVDYMHGEAQLGRFYALVLFFIGAMSGLALSSNLLFLFFFWEITALCSYALISFNNDDPKAVAGGIKALIITQLGGVGLLAGALVVYANLGSYQIAYFLENAESLAPGLLSVMAFGFLAAAAAKSAQFPFQTWLPDAMEAPTPVSALIHAATMVNAGVYLLARFYPAFEHVPGWKESVMVVGLLTALMAAVMAVVANDIKRILAYSTVSQLGYMVYAIGVGGIFASQFHLFSHALFKALLFLSAGAVIHAVGTRDIRLMGGLGKKMPWVRTSFLIGGLALAGLPILNGFWSKELILEAGISDGPSWALALMVLGAGLTGLYTLRAYWLVFGGEPRSSLHAHDAGLAMKISLGLLAAGSLTSWLLAGSFNRLLIETLPFHEIRTQPLVEIVGEVGMAPLTWITLGVIGVGMLLWWVRGRFVWMKKLFGWLEAAAKQSFGFEWVNQQIVRLVKGSSGLVAITQTGVLNWNVVGIVGGLIVILIFLAWSTL
jgi:NADH-quinone oxidoreductase subunit L